MQQQEQQAGQNTLNTYLRKWLTLTLGGLNKVFERIADHHNAVPSQALVPIQTSRHTNRQSNRQRSQ